MASPQTAPDVLRFAAEQLLAEREELREILLWNPSLPAETRDLLQPKPAPKPQAWRQWIARPAGLSRNPSLRLRLPEAANRIPRPIVAEAGPEIRRGRGSGGDSGQVGGRRED